MSTMAPAPLRYQLNGAAFVAQACSCARSSSGGCTSDPCTCGEHCSCEGADLYLGPRWRFVGDQIDTGGIDGVDVGRRIYLNLAQTSNEQMHDWHEVILIDDGAVPEQVRVLLELFEEHQSSDLNHPEGRPKQARAVYLVPMRFSVVQGQPILCATFSAARSRLVHGSASMPMVPWTFNGRVAVRGPVGR